MNPATASADTTSIVHTIELHANERTQPLEGVDSTDPLVPTQRSATAKPFCCSAIPT
jgi:hypothetical protein